VYASASPLDAEDVEVDDIDFEDAGEVDLVDAQRLNSCPPRGCGPNRVCVHRIRCINSNPPRCYTISRCVPSRRN